MTTAVLTISTMKKRIKKEKSVDILFQINWNKFCVIGAMMCAMLLLYYIYQINVITGWSYKINSYQNSIDEISRENEKLEVNFAESSFLGGVLAKAQSMNFKKITSVKYIEVLDPALANAK
jgi:hypothetical protein